MGDNGLHGELGRLKNALRSHLRKSKSTRTGREGTFCVRLFIQRYGREYTARRVEIGLGTADEEKALHAAAVLVRVLEGMGMHITSKLPAIA
jgi:hypothetical protein